MKKRQLLRMGMIVVLALAFGRPAAAKERIVFGGGPAGGVFQVVANAVQVFDPIKNAPGYRVQAQSSAGDIENIRKTDAGKVHMAVAYSGSVWNARHGKLKNDTRIYENVMALAWLYGAPAQLVVRRDAGIKSARDLVGKKVGVGPAGSGAFANCELYFSHLGIWDQIERNAVGYDDAANYFGNNQLDAFWLFVGYPSGAVMMAAQTNDIDLVNLDSDAESSGFYQKYPFFAKITIPAATYKGVDHEVATFQDSAIWIANAKVSADIIYDILSKIYSNEGLAHMADQKKTFKGMSIATGPSGIATPFHPGAERFWREKFVLK
ncbi:MAG TPA: TAXI family TRAP transporter solute-binding subunit [Proteobacteria bacterium]|nr:TAXI family TRAP transporter solute-binding subunit [Pseudomonadota bacterium]